MLLDLFPSHKLMNVRLDFAILFAGVPPVSGFVSPVVENQIEILTGDQLSSRDQRWSR